MGSDSFFFSNVGINARQCFTCPMLCSPSVFLFFLTTEGKVGLCKAENAPTQSPGILDKSLLQGQCLCLASWMSSAKTHCWVASCGSQEERQARDSPLKWYENTVVSKVTYAFSRACTLSPVAHSVSHGCLHTGDLVMALATHANE